MLRAQRSKRVDLILTLLLQETARRTQGGKPRQRDHLLSKTLCVALCDRAPDAVAEALNLPHGSSWAQAISRKLIYLAVRGDLQAMREIREATEGTRAHMSIDLPDPDAALPVIEIVFVDSDHDGRPAPGFVIDGKPAPQPTLPAAMD